MSATLVRQQITLRGVVQGVGFRPFVFNLAERLGLTGWVLNHSGGVDIEVEGPDETVEQFIHALRTEAPPLARIESVEVRLAEPVGYARFEIRPSEAQADRYQLISPDAATCPDCRREIFDPNNRRYRYPFTNCTHCGPRFTIIADIPYDRPNTTMRAFVMCPDCQREYDDPRDRRFHAQPNACPACGPQLQLVTRNAQPATRNAQPATCNAQPATCNSQPATRNAQPATCNAQPATRNAQLLTDPIQHTADLLRQGAIVAVKGLGGFQLACDALNRQAVQTLRRRKRRPHKPFALMMPTLEHVRRHCLVSPEAEALLCSPQAPIVLLPWRDDSPIAPEVAPGQRTLGVMLPYTPLHHLLLHDFGGPLVMTSGNLSEEPIAADNQEALQRLDALADAFLLHNRDIYARYDDSVWFVPASGPQPIRRARGYAPFPIPLPFECAPILAIGADLKNTFCLTRDRYAFLSPHIGDLENIETLEHLERTVKLYKHLFRIEPALIACDMHPDYVSTRYAQQITNRNPQSATFNSQLATCNLQLTPIQHHHAHLAACLADNGWPPDRGAVIGVIMDGTGYGPDGHIWGGEWLIGDYGGYRRAAHLEYLPLPGGDAATRQPWRIAVSYLYTLLGDPAAWVAPADAPLSILHRQLDRRLNCPPTSSMGRLFDAVSALLGVCRETTYEAQAAIELEQIASRLTPHASRSYSFHVDEVDGLWQVRLGGLFADLRDDVQAGVPAAEIAARFHHTVAAMIVQVCRRIAGSSGLNVVALSGGCFQNRLLLDLTVPALREAGFQVLLHRQVPCNDGGLSLGQAVIAQTYHTSRNMPHTSHLT